MTMSHAVAWIAVNVMAALHSGLAEDSACQKYVKCCLFSMVQSNDTSCGETSLVGLWELLLVTR